MSRSEWTGQAILFDLDGTLIESMGTIERHTRMWAARNGLDPELTLTAWHGRRDADVIAEFLPPEQVDAELQWMRELSCRDTAGVTAASGTHRLLAALPKGSWGIVTSGERDVAVCRLAAAGLPRPRVLVTADDVDRGKPNPEGYLSAARKLAVPPARCLVFEDAISGIQAAHRAGMQAVLLGDEAHSSTKTWGIASFKNVELAGPVGPGSRALHLTFVD
jgi:sugar-phosphatase